VSDALNADVVVVGSGVAGSLIAWRLAEARLNVLVLEAGPRIDRVEAFKSFLAARDKNASSPYPPAPYAPAPQYNAWNDYYINTGLDLFRGMYTRGVGGSTWHWAGSVLRYRPSDFRMKSRYGVGIDWPISYEELAPFYDYAERVLGVAGPNTDAWGAPRASDYPMPAIPQAISTPSSRACWRRSVCRWPYSRRLATACSMTSGRNAVAMRAVCRSVRSAPSMMRAFTPPRPRRPALDSRLRP
jgi:choline dehydrogenase-like flavoprotein